MGARDRGCIAPPPAGGAGRCAAPREPGSLFCRPHELAPAAQRGGWISAEKRRRRLAASRIAPMDASNIVKRLWIGAKPPFDRDLPEFDLLVLCAEELQPERVAFRREVLRVPLPDSALTTAQINTAILAGRRVGAALASGRCVLVTCYAGLNRSSLVAGIGLSRVSRLSPEQITDMIRRRRGPHALSNPHFVGYLERFSRPSPYAK